MRTSDIFFRAATCDSSLNTPLTHALRPHTPTSTAISVCRSLLQAVSSAVSEPVLPLGVGHDGAAKEAVRVMDATIGMCGSCLGSGIVVEVSRNASSRQRAEQKALPCAMYSVIPE